jgi:hypothetical protein
MFHPSPLKRQFDFKTLGVKNDLFISRKRILTVSGKADNIFGRFIFALGSEEGLAKFQ